MFSDFLSKQGNNTFVIGKQWQCPAESVQWNFTRKLLDVQCKYQKIYTINDGHANWIKLNMLELAIHVWIWSAWHIIGYIQMRLSGYCASTSRIRSWCEGWEVGTTRWSTPSRYFGLWDDVPLAAFLEGEFLTPPILGKLERLYQNTKIWTHK